MCLLGLRLVVYYFTSEEIGQEKKGGIFAKMVILVICFLLGISV